MDLIKQISNYIYDLENKHKLSMLNKKMYYSLKENCNIMKDYLLYFTFPNDVDLTNNNYHLKIEKYTFSLIMEINNEMIFVKKFPLVWNSFNYTFGIKIYNEIFITQQCIPFTVFIKCKNQDIVCLYVGNCGYHLDLSHLLVNIPK
jgi:hypothetical protein